MVANCFGDGTLPQFPILAAGYDYLVYEFGTGDARQVIHRPGDIRTTATTSADDSLHDAVAIWSATQLFCDSRRGCRTSDNQHVLRALAFSCASAPRSPAKYASRH